FHELTPVIDGTAHFLLRLYPLLGELRVESLPTNRIRRTIPAFHSVITTHKRKAPCATNSNRSSDRTLSDVHERSADETARSASGLRTMGNTRHGRNPWRLVA